MVTRDEIRILTRLRHPQGVVSAYLAVRPNLMHDRMIRLDKALRQRLAKIVL